MRDVQLAILKVIDQHGYAVPTLALPELLERFVGTFEDWKGAVDELATLGYIEMMYNTELPVKEPKGWVLTRRGRTKLRNQK